MIAILKVSIIVKKGDLQNLHFFIAEAEGNCCWEKVTTNMLRGRWRGDNGKYHENLTRTLNHKKSCRRFKRNTQKLPVPRPEN